MSGAKGHSTFVRDPGERGSALLVTLVVITIISVMVGIALATELVQYRFIRQDAHHVRARYIAEAGVYAALGELQRQPYLQVSDSLWGLPEGNASRITFEPFGGYLFIRSVAESGRSRYVARALVGEVPPPVFNHAVALFDEGTMSGLSLNGSTQVTGPVALVAEGRGLDTLTTIDGQGFTGDLHGEVFTYERFRVPFNTALFEYGVAQSEDFLREIEPRPVAVDTAYTRRILAGYLMSEGRVWVHIGDLNFTEADSAQFQAPLTVVASGKITLSGALQVEENTRFIAGDTLSIGGQVEVEQGLLYGRNAVIIKGTARCSGQFLSRGGLLVGEAAYLTYPTALYVTGEAHERGGRIEVTGQAVVDGTIVHPLISPQPRVPFGRVLVDTLALVRGAVFNEHETELQGRLLGSLLTHQTYFYYQSPITPGTHYVNWLRNATVDVYSRPITYRAPIGFSTSPELDIIAWEGYAEALPAQEAAI